MNIKRGRLLFLEITAIAICLITIIYFKPDEVAEVLALTQQESVEKKIAITFDDGPHPYYTPQLLDGLKERGVTATFFLTGEGAEQNPEIVRRMYEEGHLIGNHTWDHVQLDKISREKALQEIQKTNNRIYEVTGVYPSYIRPPFGAWQKDMELPFTMLPVFWDIDTLDWKSRSTDSILSIVRSQVHDGSILLMHDSYQSSVDAALMIADLLTEQGYDFVTADQLLTL